ncbi:MAG: gluconate 2-dehydrogenase subunit 3 family protein [Actinomycetota bacterium]|nr:gluconate 2-dehydrogenase subunit 3 family protein [Actinomycetota bacterium]
MTARQSPPTPYTAITPGGQGRFPGYDVLEQSPTWDDVTAATILARLRVTGPPRFFTASEETVARPLLDRLLAQDEEPKIPVFEMIDARLAANQTDGWRHEDLPEDREVWRRSLVALDAFAVAERGESFGPLRRDAQLELLEAVRTGDRWQGLPAARIWDLWLRYACTAFYAHPWSWNEIGFGGPAYPRGYKNLGVNRREPWEVADADGSDPLHGQ